MALGCSGEAMVDMYRIRSEAELKKRLARKKKKGKGEEALGLADEIVHGGCLKAQGKVQIVLGWGCSRLVSDGMPGVR